MGFSITDLMTKTSKDDMHNNAEAQLQNATFRDIRANIESKIKLMARNMVQIGYYLKLLRDKELYREAGYDNFLECAYQEFHLTESSVYRFIKANSEYSRNGNSLEIDIKYSDYNSSQLIEMINMPEEQRAGITPDMPVKEIRQLKKNAAGADESGGIASLDEIAVDNLVVNDAEDKVNSAGDAVIESRRAVVITDDNEDDIFITAESDVVSTRYVMPVLESFDQRYAFVDDYTSWPVWIDIKETDEKYYRYELSSGDAIVVKDYLYHDKSYGPDDGKKVRGKAEYYLMQQGKTFKDCESSRTMIVNYLKDIH